MCSCVLVCFFRQRNYGSPRPLLRDNAKYSATVPREFTVFLPTKLVTNTLGSWREYMQVKRHLQPNDGTTAARCRCMNEKGSARDTQVFCVEGMLPV